MKIEKIFSTVSKTAALLAVLSFAYACGDGGHLQPQGGLGTSESKAEIISFYITKAGSDEQGNSVALDSGETTVTVGWQVIISNPGTGEDALGSKAEGDDVVEAPMITLDSEALGIHLKNLPATGTQEIEDVTEDAVFILTARFGSTVDTDQVTAIVASLEELDVTFTANPAEIYSGQTAELCWTISRAVANYEVIDSNGNVISSSDLVQGDEAPVTDADGMTAGGEANYTGEESEVEPAPAMPPAPPAGTSGCATVSPAETTTYTLTASADGAEEVIKEATVTVNQSVKIDYFTATPEKLEGRGEVELSWKVTPATADVAISGINLKLGTAEFGAEGKTTVVLGQTKTFELTATLPGCDACVDTASVTVEVELKGTLKITASGTQVIFEGESAEIEWSVTDEDGSPKTNANVKIKGGGFGQQGESKGMSDSVTVSPDETTNYTIEASAPDVAEGASGTVTVVVRNWRDAGTEMTKTVTAVGVSSDDVYVGFNDGLVGGGIKLEKSSNAGSTWSTVTLPLMDVIPGISGGPNNIRNFNDFFYPVNALIVDPDDSNMVYTATTGGVFFSKDGGGKWETLAVYALNNTDDIPLPHPTCKGETHKGWPGFAALGIKGLSQACDVAIASDGRFFIATDMRVEYLPLGAGPYIEKETADNDPEGANNAAYGRVNNDLEIAKIGNKEYLFVGTSEGVLKSVDMGGSFAQVAGSGAPGGDVYAVKVDKTNKKLYAGGADGKVYKCSISGNDCSGWSSKSLGGGAVYSIAIDPIKEGAVFAATSKGIYYTPDGAEWRDVTGGPMGSADIAVRSIASAKNGSEGSVFLGTADGVFATTSDVVNEGGTQASVATVNSARTAAQYLLAK